MLFPQGRWLLCKPKFFDVRYRINPWMDPKNRPDLRKALAQWTVLHHTLLRLGGWVEYIEPVEGQPDMVFTANAGIVRGENFVLSRLKHSERRGEEPFFKAWFEKNGYTVHMLGDLAFEGEGDALLVGDVLYGGYGIRSDRAAYETVGALLEIKELVPCELIHGHFYHLDTCFCPLHNGKALCFEAAFTPVSLEAMRKHVEIFAVPENEAMKFVCNAVVLGNDIIITKGCAKTRQFLSTNGFTVHELDLSEFQKAGGSAKCLSLKIGDGSGACG